MPMEQKFNTAQEYVALARTRNIENKFDEAIELSNKALELDKQSANAYYQRGNAKSNLGRHEEAIKDYDEAIRLKPDYADAFNNRNLARKAKKEKPKETSIQQIQSSPKEFAPKVSPSTGDGNIGQETAVFIDICSSTEIIAIWEVDHYVDLFGVLKKVVEDNIKKHNGGYHKNLGDGYLVFFKDKYTDNALGFSFDVLNAVKAHSASAEPNMKFNVRIGIDCGHVKPFGKDGDRFGVCVNSASRIEGIKKESFEPHATNLPLINRILVSHKVTKAVKNSERYRFLKIGNASLRGIEGHNYVIYLLENIVS